uniref:WAP domain-containing protein n=1 Tax=Varanus komodoensis TaxID=61221 RepID=A0A8D2Q4C6_VARKO
MQPVSILGPVRMFRSHWAASWVPCLGPSQRLNMLLQSMGKPGRCPYIERMCSAMDPPNKCHHDFKCPGNMKCCEQGCGKKCVPPVFGTVPSKFIVLPGTCPAVSKLCLDPSFKNECEQDEQCSQTKKCCLQVCGKACVAPLQGTVENGTLLVYFMPATPCTLSLLLSQ